MHRGRASDGGDEKRADSGEGEAGLPQLNVGVEVGGLVGGPALGAGGGVGALAIEVVVAADAVGAVWVGQGVQSRVNLGSRFGRG